MRVIHETFLRGKKYPVGKFNIVLPTLDEIFDLGTSNYYENLQAIIMDFSELDLKELPEDITDFEIFYAILSSSKDYANTFFEGMKLFTDCTFVKEQNVIAGIRSNENRELYLVDILTEEKWLEIRKILSLAHWQKEPKRYSYADQKAKEIMEKLRKNKELVDKIKKKKGEGGLELYELIGSVCTYSNSYNLFNIWDLNYYQFFDQYYRIDADDKYKFSLQSLLAGADPKKIEIGHWASSIKHN